MKLNDKLYDILSWCGKIVLPALAVLYATLADTWGLPIAEGRKSYPLKTEI